jgi:hypothetical protein
MISHGIDYERDKFRGRLTNGTYTLERTTVITDMLIVLVSLRTNF